MAIFMSFDDHPTSYTLARGELDRVCSKPASPTTTPHSGSTRLPYETPARSLDLYGATVLYDAGARELCELPPASSEPTVVPLRVPVRGRPHTRHTSRALLARLPMVGAEALGLRLRLGHVLPLLGLPVPLILGAVIHLRARVYPDLASATARGWRRCRVRARRRRRGRGGRRAVPLLHALVAATGTLFGGARVIGPVLAQPRGTRRGVRRGLGRAGHRDQETHHARHRQYPCFHGRSPTMRDGPPAFTDRSAAVYPM